MSGEQLTTKDLTEENIGQNTNKKERRVNINDLLDRVRAEKTKEKKENYLFLFLIIGVLAVTGVIASL
tara:strand:+ start:214 stop:417 length:204 start_codon:yes stop_codon:yes gene_type:complete